MTLITALYDARVLYPSLIRNLLVHLATSGLVAARWTEQSNLSLKKDYLLSFLSKKASRAVLTISWIFIRSLAACSLNRR